MCSHPAWRTSGQRVWRKEEYTYVDVYKECVACGRVVTLFKVRRPEGGHSLVGASGLEYREDRAALKLLRKRPF